MYLSLSLFSFSLARALSLSRSLALFLSFSFARTSPTCPLSQTDTWVPCVSLHSDMCSICISLRRSERVSCVSLYSDMCPICISLRRSGRVPCVSLHSYMCPICISLRRTHVSHMYLSLRWSESVVCVSLQHRYMCPVSHMYLDQMGVYDRDELPTLIADKKWVKR